MRYTWMLAGALLAACSDTTAPMPDLVGTWEDGIVSISVQPPGIGAWHGCVSFDFLPGTTQTVAMLGEELTDSVFMYSPSNQAISWEFRGVRDGEDRLTGRMDGDHWSRTPVMFTRSSETPTAECY